MVSAAGRLLEVASVQQRPLAAFEGANLGLGKGTEKGSAVERLAPCPSLPTVPQPLRTMTRHTRRVGAMVARQAARQWMLAALA